MILYKENPKETIRKLLELISEFSKVMGCKVNTQKSFAFLYTYNEKLEREIKESIPFTTATKRMKFLGINLSIDYAKAFDCVDHNKLWKILKEMGIPDHLTWLLRNLYTGQEATVRTGHGTTDWFQIGKGVHQGCILPPCLFNLYAEYIMRNAGLEEAQAGIRLPGEISITSDMQMTPPLWQKVKKNWRASWWKRKKRVKKLA